MPNNQQYILKERPFGMVKASDFEFKETPLPTLGPDEIQVKIEYISLDPAMRGWLIDRKSYIPPVQIGEVMRAGTVGTITESNNAKYTVGEAVLGWFGVQSYYSGPAIGVTKIDPNLAPMPTYLGTLGMPGMTGYFGLLEAGKPVEGDTVVVSGAAGAVGSVVGQVAKIKGCRVVGIAGGEEKCRYVVEELGFDACIDYKNEVVAEGLKTHCPKGVNVYFDNVGGEILDDVLSQLAMRARVVICGAISQYNATETPPGPKNYLSLLVNRATMQGIVVMDYADRFKEGAMQMGTWMMEGKFKSREHIVDGIETFPETMNMLFSGENNGKLVIKV